MAKQLICSEDAVKATCQHTNPCSDCPWSPKSIPGWLGGTDAETWIKAAHGDQRIDCHVLDGAQCAGAAIYRGNVCKTPRDKSVLKLPADRTAVFAMPQQFLDHHDLTKAIERFKQSK